MKTIVIVLPAAICRINSSYWNNAKKRVMRAIGPTNIIKEDPSSPISPKITVNYNISVKEREKLQKLIGEEYTLVFIDE